MSELTQTELAFMGGMHLRLHSLGKSSIFDGVTFTAQQSAALLALAELGLAVIEARAKGGSMTGAKNGKKGGRPRKADSEITPSARSKRKARAKVE